jgi:alpha-L-fucosidase 2
VYLLPALPDVWEKGEIKGLKARGNFLIDIKWDGHSLKQATVKAIVGGVCRVRTNTPVKLEGSDNRSKKDGRSYLITIRTQKGREYRLSANR